MSEPAWMGVKANIDSHDDGHGPHRYSGKKTYWEEFKKWSYSNLGQGFSLACSEGSVIEPVTAYCYRGFRYSLERAETAEAKLAKALSLLKEARAALGGGLWDYGPGQDEHDKCDEVIGTLDAFLKEAGHEQ